MLGAQDKSWGPNTPGTDSVKLFLEKEGVCVCVGVCVRTCVHMCLCACMCVHMHVCVWGHVNLSVCMCDGVGFQTDFPLAAVCTLP